MQETPENSFIANRTALRFEICLRAEKLSTAKRHPEIAEKTQTLILRHFRDGSLIGLGTGRSLCTLAPQGRLSR
jgi:hypothetical protein